MKIIYEYSIEELKTYPVLCKSQADDLHLEKDDLRYWISRVEKDKVTIEQLIFGQWKVIRCYNGREEF